MTPMPRFRDATTALVLVCACLIQAQAQVQLGPRTSRQVQIDEARRKNIPPPAKGVRDTQWHELSPKDWNPAKFLRDLRNANPDVHDDPHHNHGDDPQVAAMRSAIQREWDAAPTVTPPDDASIRLTGFAVMLERGQGLARNVILMPYYGVGINHEPPPANQMVVVTFRQGLPRNLEQEPIWVTGRLYPLASPTVYGRVAYAMPDARWQKFPVGRYPLPPYRPLR
jgi:hypothetical protein